MDRRKPYRRINRLFIRIAKPLRLAIFISFFALPAISQTSEAASPISAQTDLSPISPAKDGNGYTLRVITREVVVEVVVRDHNDRPVADLTASDFEVFEGSKKEQTDLRRISAFKVVVPSSDTPAPAFRENTVILPIGGRCEIRSTPHYEIAFHPRNWTSGIHTIRVTTTRKHVSLSYRSDFYVGISAENQAVSQTAVQAVPPQNSKGPLPGLAAAACYHANLPPSISLLVSKTQSPISADSRFILTVPPESLDMANVTADSSQLELEIGICAFSKSGKSLGFYQSSVNKPLNATNLPTILDNGWKHQIDLRRHGNPALIRFVVREPKSGNLGIIDLAGESPNPAKKLDTSETSGRQRLPSPEKDSPDQSDRVGRRLSLGSPVPSPGALCGDVYELPTTTTFLPSDIRSLNAVGTVFTDSLAVPERILEHGLPGSTPRTEWFDIDYYGEFWVTTPGKYEFVLSADDGADLYIDDRRIIENDGIHPPRTESGSVTLQPGRHTLHLPYFQGPTYVSLILQVKPPGGFLDIFDIRDYQRPASALSPVTQAPSLR